MRTPLRHVAEGVWSGRLVPGPWLHLLVMDDIVIDAGLRWSRRAMAELLRGRDVGLHVVTHAHADHAGSSAWLCRATGAPLAMGAADAARFETGRIDTVASRTGRLVARLADPERAAVDIRLVEGDSVGSFRVLDAPGHSPGNIALWRPEDRVLIVGDGPVNLSGDPTSPRFVHLPRSLHHDVEQVRRTRQRLADLEPRVVVPVHGHPVTNTSAWAVAMRRG